MHNYSLRINFELWNRIVAEANSRGITIKQMIIELLERGLLQIVNSDYKKYNKEE